MFRRARESKPSRERRRRKRIAEIGRHFEFLPRETRLWNVENVGTPSDTQRLAWAPFQGASVFASLRDRSMAMADRISARGAGRPEHQLREIVASEVRSLLEAVSRAEF
jgi:hypothetical protein